MEVSRTTNLHLVCHPAFLACPHSPCLAQPTSLTLPPPNLTSPAPLPLNSLFPHPLLTTPQRALPHSHPSPPKLSSLNNSPHACPPPHSPHPNTTSLVTPSCSHRPRLVPPHPTSLDPAPCLAHPTLTLSRSPHPHLTLPRTRLARPRSTSLAPPSPSLARLT